MNKVLLFAVCSLLIAGLAHSQLSGNLGIYGDPYGTICILNDPGPQVIQYYVVHNLTPATQASRFRAPIPECMIGAFFLSDETMWPIKIGLVTEGTLVGYGGCVSSPILVMTINIFAQGLTGDCCLYPILPDPSGVTGEVEAQGCDGVWRWASTVTGVINPTPTCWCEVATEVTTWGKIKALYTE
jgi:hypothetical protein